MLSELQRKQVWEGWLSAEIRANYFADLSGRYQRWHKWLTWSTLVFSSAAFIAFIADSSFTAEWVQRPMMAFAAAVSLWSVVAQFYKAAIECSDLHFRWMRLSTQYEDLWGDMYSGEAAMRLHALREREAELSKSSAQIPHKPKLMEKWEDHVVRHHTAAAAA